MTQMPCFLFMQWLWICSARHKPHNCLPQKKQQWPTSWLSVPWTVWQTRRKLQPQQLQSQHMSYMRRAPILTGRLQSEVVIRDRGSSSSPTAGENDENQILNSTRCVAFCPYFWQLKVPVNQLCVNNPTQKLFMFRFTATQPLCPFWPLTPRRLLPSASSFTLEVFQCSYPETRSEYFSVDWSIMKINH